MPAPSARSWEAEFIQLWQAGASHVDIAHALGCPVGTVKSRAHTLQQQGKIQARLHRGLVPVQRPVQSTALAAKRDLSPSQLVQEFLWKALGERRQQKA